MTTQTAPVSSTRVVRTLGSATSLVVDAVDGLMPIALVIGQWPCGVKVCGSVTHLTLLFTLYNSSIAAVVKKPLHERPPAVSRKFSAINSTASQVPGAMSLRQAI